MIVKKVSFNDFLEEFKKYGREDQFTYEGKKALYEYLEGLNEDIREPIVLDVIAIACDYIEYSSIDEFNDDYSYSIGDIDSIDDIEYYTTVIPINEEAFIIQVF